MRGDGVQIADPSGRRLGWRRPVALPDDIDNDDVEKAHGLVRLPPHVSWSGADAPWDMDDPRQLLQLYEIVLTEGTDDDVRRFIDIDELVRMWTQLWLSPHVRLAWRDHIRRMRGIELEC
jgi:hypothetical protein